MKWYKHLSGMRHDPKVRRLIRKYGSDGWTVYTVIVESIAESLDPISQIVPVLQETSEDIALEFSIDSRRVEEIVGYCVQQELLEADENGMVFCFKLYKYADDYFTKKQKNKESYADRNKQIIAAYKEYGVRDAIISILQTNPQAVRTLYFIGSYYRVTPELLRITSGKAGYEPGNSKYIGDSQNSGVAPDLLPQEESIVQRVDHSTEIRPEEKKPFSFLAPDFDGSMERAEGSERIDVDGQIRYKHKASRIDKWIRKSAEMNSFPTERKAIASKSNFSEIQDNLSYYQQDEIDIILETYEEIYNSSDHEPHAEFTSISNFLANDNIKLYLPENNPLQRFQKSKGFAGSYRNDYTNDDFEQTMKLMQEKG